MPRKRGAAEDDAATDADAANDASVSAPNLPTAPRRARATDTCDKKVCLGVGLPKLGALFGNYGLIGLVLVLGHIPFIRSYALDEYDDQ